MEVSEDRHAMSFVKDAALNVLLMVLKKGAHLHEHRTKGPITVQVVSGSIRFSAGEISARSPPASWWAWIAMSLIASKLWRKVH